ncbi:MAG: BRO family protein [Lactobacillus iners]|nr:BRO family protein [Lactobacillus iners]
MENMESGIQTFYFKNEEIKIKVIGNEPYFSLEEACKILEIKNPLIVKKRLLDEQGVCGVMTFTPMGFKETDFISEANLYRLIFKLHRRENLDFVVWIASEVLPTFIKNKIAKKLINDLEKM